MNTQPHWLILFIGAVTLANFPTMAQADSSYAASLCKTSGYSCIKAKRGDSWTSLWPDLEQRRIVMQVNRTNTSLYKNRLIAIPKNLSVINYLDLAPFKQQIDPPGEKVLIFDPSERAWAAYNRNGNLVRWGAASGGASWCDDIQSSCRTPVGTFRIYQKGDSDCISTKYPLPEGGAHMPYCMFFHGGFALHGSPGAVMGYNASHGCTRLFVHDAEWLNKEFATIGTKVIVRPYGNRATVKSVPHEVARSEAQDEEIDTVAVPQSATPREGRTNRLLHQKTVADPGGETTIEEISPQ